MSKSFRRLVLLSVSTHYRQLLCQGPFPITKQEETSAPFTRVPQMLPLHMWRKIKTFCFPRPRSRPSLCSVSPLLALSHMRVYKHKPLWISVHTGRIWEIPLTSPFWTCITDSEKWLLSQKKPKTKGPRRGQLCSAACLLIRFQPLRPSRESRTPSLLRANNHNSRVYTATTELSGHGCDFTYRAH